MKKLADIIRDLSQVQIYGDAQIMISGFCLDSRKVQKGNLFVAVRGSVQDGNIYIPSAIQSGAAAILCEQIPDSPLSGVTYIRSDDLNGVLASMLNEWYGNPSSSVKLIGITGTNGKTTTASLLYELFTHWGFKCGLISTVQYRVHQKVYDSSHTTPDIIRLYALLDEMVREGCTYVFMEVSSHAVDQNRIRGLQYAGAVFTNITPDHMDYHGTFSKYIAAKKKFFDGLQGGAFALYNTDDPNGHIMVQNTKATKFSYGLKNMAVYKGKILDNNLFGLHLSINKAEVHTRLIGEFNAYNLVCVYAVAELLGQPKEEILIGLSSLPPVEGRFEWFRSPEKNVIAIVDYAHTPDALEKILTAIRKIQQKDQSLITVMGCGGNRDRSKRPVMGEIAVRMSDKVIFTSDNPRDEDPEEIIKEIAAGVHEVHPSKHICITDRAQAIKTACMLANFSDIILVAGKGHEKYQEIKGVKYPFDDLEILKTILLN